MNAAQLVMSEVAVASRTSASNAAQASARVLIVAHTTTFLTELSLFGKLVRARTDAEVVFHCPFAHWTADEFAKSCAREGIVCLVGPTRESMARTYRLPEGESARPNRLRRLLSAITGRIARRLRGVGASFLAEWNAFTMRAGEIDSLLSAVKPRLLVLGGDMAGYDTSLFIKLAREREVPTLIVPSTMSNGLEQAEVYFEDPNYHVRGWSGHLIAALFPKWVRSHKGKRLFRCPPGRLLAMELAGLAPPQPWIFNSGFADAIAMESQAMIDYYADAGMSHDRMVLTGSLSDDAMARTLARAPALRAELCRQLGLDPDRPLILMALLPDFLYLPGGRPQCDFQDYEKLVDFWIDSLGELKGCNRIVALHPSVDVESMRHIERCGVRIGRWRTADMVPLCDVYVASISSTIRWAIACGKPVVNYDVYRYRYTDFAGVPGVLSMEDQEPFTATLRRLAADGEYRRSIAEAQQSVASRWGLLDGRVGDRMLSLVERLTERFAGPKIDFRSPETTSMVS
jgi:hypothetical protein